MTREVPPGGVGPDRGPRSGKSEPDSGKQSGRFGDAAMYAATGGAKVAKAGAYVTGGSLVAVYGAGISNIGTPESTGYESNQFGHSDPAERIFPDLTPPDGGPAPVGPIPELAAATSPAPAFSDDYNPPALTVNSVLSAAESVSPPSFAEAFPTFSDNSHPFEIGPLNNIAANINGAGDQLGNMLHGDQGGGGNDGSNLFSGIGDGSSIGIYSSITADSSISIDVSVSGGISTSLEISSSGISLEVDSSLSVSVEAEASVEVTATTEVGRVNSQSSSSSSSGNSLRGGGSGGAGFGSGASFTGASFGGQGGGLNGSGNGLGGSGTPGQGPTITTPTSHTSFGSQEGTQPVNSTPMQTAIQPDAGLHPIADVTSTNAPGALTAPAASLPLIFGTTSHQFGSSGSNHGTTSNTFPSTGGISDDAGHGSLPTGIGTSTHTPFSLDQLSGSKSSTGSIPQHSTTPGGGGTGPSLPTHTTAGNTGITPGGIPNSGTTETPHTDTGTTTGLGGNSADHFGADTTPSEQGSSTVPQQHTPDIHLPDNSVSSVPGSGLSPTSPGAGISPSSPGVGGETGLLGGHTSPLTTGGTGSIPSVPTAPLGGGGISPGAGGSLVNPLHTSGASFTLPPHPTDHADAIGARLTLSATGHGLSTGLMSAGLPSHTHDQWDDHHITLFAHH